MGLQCSHGAFSGSYRAFNRFRRSVCRAIGLNEDIWASCGEWSFPSGYSPESHPGLWELLHHSDCDGVIPPALCEAIAVELTDFVLIKLVKMTDGVEILDGGHAEICLQFIRGCQAAAILNENMTFS